MRYLDISGRLWVICQLYYLSKSPVHDLVPSLSKNTARLVISTDPKSWSKLFVAYAIGILYRDIAVTCYNHRDLTWLNYQNGGQSHWSISNLSHCLLITIQLTISNWLYFRLTISDYITIGMNHDRWDICSWCSNFDWFHPTIKHSVEAMV